MVNSADLSDRVCGLIRKGKEDEEIVREAHVSGAQLAAYKASLRSRLNGYFGSNSTLSLPKDKLDDLRPYQVAALVEILQTIREDQSIRRLARRAYRGRRRRTTRRTREVEQEPPVPRERIRAIVGELLRRHPNEPDYSFIHSDPRLRGVGKMVIAGYIANWNAGTYDS